MAINEGFFEKFPGLMKKLFVNEGAMERAGGRALKKEYRKSGEAVMKSVDGDMGKAKSLLRDVKNEANGDIRAEAIGRRGHATGKTASEITGEDATKIIDGLDNRVKRGTAMEAAKGYFTEPMKNLKSADEATRRMAVGQLAARGGAVAGGTALTMGLGHDLFSNDENDTGFGGVVGNTVGAGALGAGGAAAAAGMSMLKKL